MITRSEYVIRVGGMQPRSRFNRLIAARIGPRLQWNRRVWPVGFALGFPEITRRRGCRSDLREWMHRSRTPLNFQDRSRVGSAHWPVSGGDRTLPKCNTLQEEGKKSPRLDVKMAGEVASSAQEPSPGTPRPWYDSMRPVDGSPRAAGKISVTIQPFELQIQVALIVEERLRLISRATRRPVRPWRCG